MIKKKSILSIKNIYTANAFRTGDTFYIGAGSETDPVSILYNLRSETQSDVEGSPGGMMSFLPVPGHPGYFVTIMGLFPPFIGSEAGIYLHRKENGSWKTKKAADLPFAHRCEFLRSKGNTYLVAATVSRHKENPADWSKPGEICLFRLGASPEEPWEKQVMEGAVVRNHGMFKSEQNETENLYISGAEGIFRVVPPAEGPWQLDPVFDKEVSEFTFIDLDGDGESELVTIEPFHGNTLNMYKGSPAGWERHYQHPLTFGHGLSSGIFNGNPLVVAGNRGGDLTLCIFTVDNLVQGAVNKYVMEREAGPTQTQVFSFDGEDYILSANQRKNEVALYYGTLD